MRGIKRAILIVLDSVGIGGAPDAADFGDEGSHTLLHIAERVGLHLPHLASLGLGNIVPLPGVPPHPHPQGAYGMAREQSRGKDTVTGHWEITGVITPHPFPVYPDGFPEGLIKEFEEKIGRKTIGNKAASGTAIIAELGDEHVATGHPIVYTSADSVFQIAAHEEVIALEELYRYCRLAREMLDVNRIIARPFVGEKGNYTRTPHRHDYALPPPQDTLLDQVKASGLPVVAVGKISDIFAGRGITAQEYTRSNQEGVEVTLRHIRDGDAGIIFTNLVDFDTLYGHRRDPGGYKAALEAFDERLPEILAALKPSDLLILTADHGCDPTFRGSDHTRERVPVLVAGQGIAGVNLGERESYADIAATLRELLLGVKGGKGVKGVQSATSFAGSLGWTGTP